MPKYFLKDQKKFLKHTLKLFSQTIFLCQHKDAFVEKYIFENLIYFSQFQKVDKIFVNWFPI